MSKKILIDLAKFRDPEDGKYNFGECIYNFHPNNIGMKDIVEKAMMLFTCRRCEDSPCIAVCPEEALEKDDEGFIVRATNLCIGCQSCVAVCPFGSIMNEVFTSKKSICDLCDFDDNTKTLKCMETAPEGAISIVDLAENKEENIHKLNEKILVREFIWDKLMKNE